MFSDIKIKTCLKLYLCHVSNMTTKIWVQLIVFIYFRQKWKVPLLGLRHFDKTGGLLNGASGQTMYYYYYLVFGGCQYGP